MKRFLLLASLCVMAFVACTKTVVKDPAPDVLAESITLDKDKLVVIVSEQARLHVAVLPEDAGPIVWVSNAPSIASVNNEGVVTGVDLGEADIFAVSGEFLAKCHVRVVSPITGITLDSEPVKVVRTKPFQLTATITPADATEPIEWISENPDVVSVDEDGIVTGLVVGNATIRAKSAKAEASCEIEVLPLPVSGVDINADRETLGLLVGETIQFTAQVLPVEADDQTIIWSVDDATIVSVDENGLATALKTGFARVKASASNGAYSTYGINVSDLHSVPFLADFETDLDQWTAYYRDGEGLAWFYGESSGNHPAHSGSYFLGSYSYYTGYGALTPDNWLITPIIQLDETYNRLSFWAGPYLDDYPFETYAAYLFIKDEVEDFDNAIALLKGTLTQGYEIIYGQTPPEDPEVSPTYRPRAVTWEQVAVDIPEEFNGKKVFVAIRHFECTDQYALLIDDLEVTNVKAEPEPDPDPEPEPQPTAPRLLKGDRSIRIPSIDLPLFGNMIVK